MPELPPPASAKTLKDIEADSQRLNQLATELSQRISAFESWLDQLPGKVEAESWVTLVSETEQECFGVRLSRAGKRWSLFCSYSPVEDAAQWTPLAEVCIETKLVAIQQFPQLLVSISKAQARLVRQLEKAHGEFDTFAHAIGLTQQKEGK